MNEIIRDLNELPTSYHFVASTRSRLLSLGYTELYEKEAWSKIPDNFFVTYQDTSIVAIRKADLTSGIIYEANSASMALQVGQEFSISCGCEQCDVIPYGNGVWWSWIDRDLTVAGSVTVRGRGNCLVNLRDTVCMIPSLAVHLSHGGVSGTFDASKHFKPIFSLKQEGEKLDTLHRRIAEALECEVDDIIDYDLFLVPNDPADVVGIDKKHINGYRVDAILGSIAGINALCNTEAPKKGMHCVAIVNDPSEGAGDHTGSFLSRVLTRLGCGPDFFAKSVLVSNRNTVGTSSHAGGATYEDGWRSRSGTSLESMDRVITALTSANISIKKVEPKRLAPISRAVAIAAQHGMHGMTIGVPITSLRTVRERIHCDDARTLLGIAESLFQDVVIE